ncbi:MAG: agmatine deiminase family protein [Bacteroidota bacterium]|nr:agmatine deiminase family protein [Bacteroidota bacterium]MDP4216899.1 agmatine deiminase family protein [Bacteroidota bacterium]MDP4253171.1 agmatine deiminase family protein [Bacteroidota bacterium]
MPDAQLMNAQPTPAALGYRFPAEFARHEATWLSWPHKEASWPGKIQSIYPNYSRFVKELAAGEKVRINVNDRVMQAAAGKHLAAAGVNMLNVEFFLHPTNDAWCRDHGPAFLVNPDAAQKKVIVDWNYNAWGNKYPPYDLDDVIPTRIGEALGIPVYHPGIIMEGGSVDFNGAGTLITSTCCLLNKNRNPQLDRDNIESCLMNYYGVQQVLWVEEGIVGDDTDGHIDDTVRWVNDDTVLAAIEENKKEENYALLQRNLSDLKKMRLPDGRALNIVELPMPDAVIYEDQRLPASYANFYIANQSVIVPVFRCDKDERALRIIADCFPGRQVVGIDSTDIIWGLGSFHCLSQQEPAV